MSTHHSVRVALPLIGLLICHAAADAQQAGASLKGRVTDASGGALPGAAVTVTCPAADVTAATVTDGTGSYALDSLPPTSCVVIFELAGFDTVGIGDLSLADDTPTTLNQQLEVAPLTETVNVVAKAPPPPPKPRIVPEPRPVPIHDIASVCGPAAPTWPPPADPVRLAANRDGTGREMYAKGDVIVVNAGTAKGVDVGDNFVVRRLFRVNDPNAPFQMFGEHSSGLIQVVAAEPEVAEAVIVYACDEFVRGDYLESFEPVVMPRPVGGIPDFSSPARILFADEGQTVGAPRRLMVIDQGRRHGATMGQRWTVFRRARKPKGAIEPIADAVVVALKEETATVRIEHATDAVFFGDEIAPHRRLAVTSGTAPAPVSLSASRR